MGKKGGKGDEDYVATRQRGGKAKGKKGRRFEEAGTSDMEDDMSSFVSNLSYQNHVDRDSVGEGSATGESGIEENDAVDQQLDIALEAAALKNTVVRVKNLKIIDELLSGKIVSEVLFKRKEEMTEVLLKSFKTGKGSEQVLTARLTALFVMQMGDEVDLERLYEETKPYLTSAIGSADQANKAKLISVLTTLCFICEDDNIDERKELVLMLRDRSKTADVDVMASVFSSLSLLLTISTPTERRNVIQMILPVARQNLQSPSVDVRIEAGALIAHMFQLAREIDPDWDSSVADMDGLIGDLETLATDSAKYRAKRDKKLQRASFREILSSVSGDGLPSETVKVGQSEIIRLESWSERVQYGAVKELLGGSTSLHLSQNPFVRGMFGLGAPPLHTERSTKLEKHEMKKLTAACHKARQRNMLKQRDKRMVI